MRPIPAARFRDTPYIDRIRTLAWNVARQLFLTESYKDLGTLPPVWMSVQQTLDTARLPSDKWNCLHQVLDGRLEIYADPLLPMFDPPP